MWEEMATGTKKTKKQAAAEPAVEPAVEQETTPRKRKKVTKTTEFEEPETVAAEPLPSEAEPEPAVEQETAPRKRKKATKKTEFEEPETVAAAAEPWPSEPEPETAAEEVAEEAPAAVKPEDGAETAEEAESGERLQKLLARAGVASRRKAEELIAEGRVQVNGQVVTEPGTRAVMGRDHVRVDGKLLQAAERMRYFVLNKPKGYVTTVSDPEGRATVMEFFQSVRERVYPVGRLDYLSEGLLVMTNDGELANGLTRAANGVEKRYLVKVSGEPDEEALDELRGGVVIERGRPGTGTGRVRTAPAQIRKVRQGDNPWFEVVLIEGRNRELRKMFEEIGHHVEKIRRVGYGPLELDVEPGKLRELDEEEVRLLRLASEGKWKPKRRREPISLPKEAGRSVDHAKAGRSGAGRPMRSGERSREAGSRYEGRAESGGGRPSRPFAGRSDRPASGRSGAGRPAAGRVTSDRMETGRAGAERPGRERSGFAKPGFSKPGFSKPGFSKPGFSKPGFSEPGFSEPGFSKPDFEPSAPARGGFQRKERDRGDAGASRFAGPKPGARRNTGWDSDHEDAPRGPAVRLEITPHEAGGQDMGRREGSRPRPERRDSGWERSDRPTGARAGFSRQFGAGRPGARPAGSRAGFTRSTDSRDADSRDARPGRAPGAGRSWQDRKGGEFGRPEGGRERGGSARPGADDRERSSAGRSEGEFRPGSSRPGSFRPGSSRPGSSRPGSSRPGSFRPDSSRPGSSRPGSSRPSGARSFGSRPGGSRPASSRSAAGASGRSSERSSGRWQEPEARPQPGGRNSRPRVDAAGKTRDKNRWRDSFQGKSKGKPKWSGKRSDKPKEE